MNNNIPTPGQLVIRPGSFNDIPFIQQIVKETWPVAYGDILSKQQIDYMLGLFYSAPSLQQQLSNGHHFLIAVHNEEAVGFAGFNQLQPTTYKLQKLYVLPSAQKTGVGRALLGEVEGWVQSKGGKRLHLNVNRQNPATTFYQKWGFTIIRQEDIDIGNGYFMNDFVMEKLL